MVHAVLEYVAGTIHIRTTLSEAFHESCAQVTRAMSEEA
jgi:hypothetical protein